MNTPVVIFPTKILLIDDDFIYAKIFSKNILRNEGIFLEPMASPLEILKQKDNDFIFRSSSNIAHIKYCTELTKNQLQIQKQLEGTVSIIIADFHMPNMNGIEFFKEIKSPFIYKILISNFIDSKYSEYINKAINNNIINAFLDKKRNLENNLKKCIVNGNSRFFSLLSSILIPEKNQKILDPEFAQLIWNMVLEKNPEYVHANEQLNCFYLKCKNKQYTIYISSVDETVLLLESYQAEIASKTTIEKLASHNFILAIPDPFSTDGSMWANFLRPANKLKGRFDNYLFTMVEESSYEQ